MSDIERRYAERYNWIRAFWDKWPKKEATPAGFYVPFLDLGTPADFYVQFESTAIPGATVRCGIDRTEATAGAWGLVRAGHDVVSTSINGCDLGPYLTNEALAMLDAEAMLALRNET